MKKFFLILILLLIIPFFGILFKTKDNDNKIVLKFSTWGSKTEIDLLKPMIKDFELQNPNIKVELIHIPQNYFQKLHLLFASNSAPDVIFINNFYIPFFANAGVLEPIKAENNIFEKKALEVLSYNQNLYAIPRDISVLVVFRNKDLFKKCKVELNTDEWTLQDMVKTSEKFRSCKIFGISFEASSPIFYLPYLMSNGTGILTDDTKTYIFDNNETQKQLKFYANLRKKYHIAPTSSESANLTMAQMFLQQKVAMHLTGHWLVPKYLEEASFNWDTITFPKGSKGSVVSLDASGWAISKTSKHKTEAIKFINYLSSDKNIEKFSKSGLIVPARIDTLNGEFKNSPFNNAFINAVKTSKPTPVSVNYNEVLDKAKQKTDVLFN